MEPVYFVVDIIEDVKLTRELPSDPANAAIPCASHVYGWQAERQFRKGTRCFMLKSPAESYEFTNLSGETETYTKAETYTLYVGHSAVCLNTEMAKRCVKTLRNPSGRRAVDTSGKAKEIHDYISFQFTR